MNELHGCGFLLTDAAGRIVYANDALCRISRRSRFELLGAEAERLLAMTGGLEVNRSPIYGRGGEYLGGFAIVRAVN